MNSSNFNANNLMELVGSSIDGISQIDKLLLSILEELTSVDESLSKCRGNVESEYNSCLQDVKKYKYKYTDEIMTMINTLREYIMETIENESNLYGSLTKDIERLNMTKMSMGVK